MITTSKTKVIFNKFGATIYELQTDRGTEFLGPCKKLFKEENILYKTKFGKNKANFAEHSIFLVKRKLYMLLRGTLSQNWVEALPQVVNSFNKSPVKKLGGLTPNSIQSEKDSVTVDKAQDATNIQKYIEPTFLVQRQNQKSYLVLLLN